MNGLADRHRRLADVVEPLERMGVDAAVEERATDDGDLCVTLDLRIPPALDAIDDGEAVEHVEALEAQCEQLREERDEARERVDEVLRRAESLEDRVAELEDRDVGSESDDEPELEGRDGPDVADDDLTDGERETLHALRELGGSRASGAIAAEVDAELQSVRSWLPKLVQAGHVRAVPDPSDGRRKLYSPVGCEEPPEDGSEDGSEDATGTVYIASSGGSPSQVFHVRQDCPQLEKSADSVEKDRAVVPHHRPCSTCVPDGLGEGLVAIAAGSQTATYHKREDCPKLGSAIEVEVTERETVPNYDPCGDCVREDGDGVDEDGDGVDEDGDGVGEDGDGVGEDGDGVGEDGDGVGEDGDGVGEDGDGVGEDGDGVGEDGNGVGEDGDGVGEDRDGVGEDGGEGNEDHTAAGISARNDFRREDVVEALDGATAIYHVRRELGLSSDETEALLAALGVFEDLDGGGNVTPDRAKSVVREHVPRAKQLESDGGGTGA